MAFEVVDAAERSAVDPGERLGGLDADQKRAHEPRSLCHRDAVEVSERHAGVAERPSDHRHHDLEMPPRGKLWHHAAIGSVHVVLRGHHAREDLAPAVEHGGRSLIAGCLDAQHDHSFSPFLLHRRRSAPSSNS